MADFAVAPFRAAHPIARNSLFSIAGQVALKLLSFGFTVFVIRYLGDHEFGRYSTVLAFVGIVAVFADWGLAGYAVREIAKEHRVASTLFGDLVAIRILLSAGVLIVNVLLARALGYDNQMVGWIALASLGLILASVHGSLSVVLQGFERFDYSASYNVLTQIAFIAFAAALLASGWGITSLVVASLLSVLPTSVLAWRTVLRFTDLSWGVRAARWGSLLRGGLPFGITTFATMLSFKVDTVLLSLWRTPEEVGWYNVAYNLIFSLLIFSTGFNNVLVPSFSRQYVIDPRSINLFYTRAVRLLWVAGLPIAVGTTLLSGRIVEFLYGRDYAPAAPALRIIIWVLPVLMLTSLCGSITTVLHREQGAARINVANAVFNVTLNLWAVPRYGLFGAAIVTVATEVLGLFQYGILLSDTLPMRGLAVALGTPFIAVAVMAGFTILASTLPLIVLIALAGMVYSVFAIGSGALPLAELKLIISSTFDGLGSRPRSAAQERSR